MKDNFNRADWKPVLVQDNLESFGNEHPGLQVVDMWDDLTEELFLLRNPKHKFDKEYADDLVSFREHYESKGNWFYFPWLNMLIRYLIEDDHFEVRTGRNKNLITKKEQEKYYNSCVAVLGMSVGSHVALTIAMTGGAKYMHLADLDIISGSNLNRIRSGFSQIGLAKVKSVARQIYEINPYADITIYEEGVTEENLNKMINGKINLDLIVEEMDNPFFKIKTRELARPKGIPVIMAADNGDGVNVDVERYDLDSKTPILHDIIPNINSELFRETDPKELVGIIAKMAGAEYANERMLQSVSEVGKSLYSWPQLGTAATLCGSVLANLGRRIILGEDIKTGRYIVNEKEMFKKVI